jgi:hypothetical protein
MLLTPKEMDALDERIAQLEAEIEGYRAEYATASSEDKRQLRELINTTRQILKRLLDEKKTAATAGMRSCVYIYCVILFVVEYTCLSCCGVYCEWRITRLQVSS